MTPRPARHLVRAYLALTGYDGITLTYKVHKNVKYY
jgi:hypothetical protein